MRKTAHDVWIFNLPSGLEIHLRDIPQQDLDFLNGVEQLTKQRDELLAALEQFATWGRMQHKAQSKGCHATFDMLALRDEIELAEAAIAAAKQWKEK